MLKNNDEILSDFQETMKKEDATPNSKNRRSFLKNTLAAGAAVAGASALSSRNLLAQRRVGFGGGRLNRGDVAILKFLAAAELIEADLWQQYAELGGLTPGQQPVETAPFTPMNGYQAALMNLDSDGPQYISSNNLDEQSHAQFLNAYLVMRGQTPVNFDQFRTLPSSMATGAQQIGRLTNLMQLSIDTSWYTRYHSSTNPDLGATFAQALPALANGQFQAIPKTDADFAPAARAQALANTAAFHFGFIEQGGLSLYATLAQQVSDVEVLRVLLSLGGDEIAHFLEWVDFSGNGVQPPVAPVTDPVTGLVFPNFDVTVNPLLQTNLIFPVPCEFISSSLPPVSIIRPTGQGQIDAVSFVNALIADGLFIGQPETFTAMLFEMGNAADEAVRSL
jgi:hypothetical protein